MILIIDCGSSKVPFIEEMVYEFMDHETIGLFDLGELDFSKYKGIIISGAPILITEVDLKPYEQAFEWISECPIPILGICFGHQMLGMHFGAYGAKQREDRDLQEIEQLLDSPLFNRLPQVFEMMEDHCENISIPSSFDLICTSDACVNEGMQHKSKAFYGVQFHPEVSGNMGAILIENFIKLCEK